MSDKFKRNISIYDSGGKVIFALPDGTDLVLEQETARQMGEALARAAYTAHFGVTPDTNRSLISEQKRTMLITRCAHVMRNLYDNQVPLQRLAMEVVDTLLAEVS